MEFKWDDAKAAANFIKHRVPFPYATAVFLDPARVEFDVSRPDDERRSKAVGMIDDRLFTVVYTFRGGVVRIISARRCNDQEARRYGEVSS